LLMLFVRQGYSSFLHEILRQDRAAAFLIRTGMLIDLQDLFPTYELGRHGFRAAIIQFLRMGVLHQAVVSYCFDPDYSAVESASKPRSQTAPITNGRKQPQIQVSASSSRAQYRLNSNERSDS